MTITFTWYSAPIIVMVVTFFVGLRLFRADLIGFLVSLVFSAGMGVFATLITLSVWGITR